MKRSLPILACLLAVGLFFACKPDASPQAKEAEAWLTTYYTQTPIRGGWGFFGAQAKDENVSIEINVPDQQSLDLMAFKEADRKLFIARNVCPPLKIWTILDGKGDVIIHTRRNGEVFAEVSCRENIKGS